MKYAELGLLNSTTNTYDKTKTTLVGRIKQSVLDGGKTVLGPSPNLFFDVNTDSGITMVANDMIMTDNGRLFVLSSEVNGLVSIVMYEGNYTTGVGSYIGKIVINIPDSPAATNTFRSIKVIDDGTTNWKFFLTTTSNIPVGSLINAGTFLINNIDRNDFVPVGFPTIPFGTGDNQKAVYKLEDPANQGVAHQLISAAGSVLDKTHNRLYVHNGIAATHQYFVFDTSIAPTYVTFSATGTAGTSTVVCSGHPYNNGAPVVFTALTGGTGLTVGTIYYIVNSVAGTSFQLSATPGGAAINFTSNITASTIGRGFGTSASLFLWKTGNLPALTGTLLLTDSEDLAIPQTAVGPSIAINDRCAFFCTNTQLYMGKLSELTAGATTWPSLYGVNALGSTNQLTSVTITNAAWSNTLDRAVYSTGYIYVMKGMVNNHVDRVFGGTSNTYLEGFNFETIRLQLATTVNALDCEAGWLAVGNITAGQRGVIMSDLSSDSFFDNSYLITKVIDLPPSKLKFVTTTDALFDYTGSLEIFYRTSGFDSPTGGWVELPFSDKLDAYASGSQIQFKIKWATLDLDTCIPAQLQEFYIAYESLIDNSDHWELSVDDSENGSPSRSAFRLKSAYSTAVPALRYLAYDLFNSNVVDHNTTSNTVNFEYSSDGGVTWNTLGTIPNTVGTLVRYTFTTPPGVDIRPSLREV